MISGGYPKGKKEGSTIRRILWRERPQARPGLRREGKNMGEGICSRSLTGFGKKEKKKK